MDDELQPDEERVEEEITELDERWVAPMGDCCGEGSEVFNGEDAVLEEPDGSNDSFAWL